MKMRICFKCLQLDATVPRQRMNQWKKDHQVNCTSEWMCKEGKCGKLTEHFQQSMLLCADHAAENKARKADMVKA